MTIVPLDEQLLIEAKISRAMWRLSTRGKNRW